MPNSVSVNCIFSCRDSVSQHYRQGAAAGDLPALEWCGPHRGTPVVLPDDVEPGDNKKQRAGLSCMFDSDTTDPIISGCLRTEGAGVTPRGAVQISFLMMRTRGFPAFRRARKAFTVPMMSESC